MIEDNCDGLDPEPALTEEPTDMSRLEPEIGTGRPMATTAAPAIEPPPVGEGGAPTSAPPLTSCLLLDNCWCRSGSVVVRLSGRGDVGIRYATVHVGTLKKAGLLPPDYFPVHGEILFSLVEGYNVFWRVNRHDGSTLAAHFPIGLELPAIKDGKLMGRGCDMNMIGSLNEATLMDPRALALLFSQEMTSATGRDISDSI